MKISGIIWIDEIIDKLEQKHNVQQDEVRQVLRNDPHFRLLKRATGREKMSMLPWEEPTQAAS